MKKTFSIFGSLFVLILCACSISHEMQDGVSFEGLKTFYVDTPAGTSQMFSAYGDVASVDAVLKSAIAQNLKEKGFEQVADKSKAQIIFRPLWNVSIKSNENQDLPLSLINAQQSSGIGFSSQKTYATLEIQAILPDGDIWAWRGFSPMEMSINNFTSGMIADQVKWCLEYFPPEEYPDTLQEIKSEKQIKKAEAQQNPYNEVLIKEREKQDKLPSPSKN